MAAPCVVQGNVFGLEGVATADGLFVALDGFVAIQIGPSKVGAPPVLEGVTPEPITGGLSVSATLSGVTNEPVLEGASASPVLEGVTDEPILEDC